MTDHSEDQKPQAKVQKTQKINGVRGMNDLLPADAAQWAHLEQVLRDLTRAYGYEFLRTPIVEATAVFQRGIGEVTDIVEKEMYSFEDRLNGEALTLRPESTAGVVRAVVEHNMLYEGGKRLYYMGPMFRHERPQRGRYRQFHQIGAEVLGFQGPEIDAEVILLAHDLWQAIGLKDVRLELNSLGQPPERLAHRAALITHFEKHQAVLDEDAKRRLYTNPLRILDTKNPALKDVVESAPQLMSFLGEASLAHFNALRQILDANGVLYSLNPRLVRGMDYYNLTVFEFITDQLGSQGTVCGGGRYDYLIEQVGGKPAPAVGWALGIERVLALLEEQGVQLPEATPHAYAIVPDANSLPLVLKHLRQLRALGVNVQMHAGSGEGVGSMKTQFKKADSSGAAYALIFGADELAQNTVSVKSLRDGGGAQRTESLEKLDTWALSLQSTS
jgi:histidyl-tRNA synthetase